jgi:hypothetical protein
LISFRGIFVLKITFWHGEIFEFPLFFFCIKILFKCKWRGRSVTHPQSVIHPLFLQICEVGGLAIHPQEEWAKFGENSKNKVENFGDPAYISVLRHPLDGPGCKFGLIWSKLNPWVGPSIGPSLASCFFKWWWALSLLSSFSFGVSNQLIFLPKLVSCRFSLDFPLFGLGPSSKGHGSNLWLSPNTIALFHGTRDLESSSKVALINHPLGYGILPFTT